MTNREAHEEAAGMGLCSEFFVINNLDPDAPYAGQEPTTPQTDPQGAPTAWQVNVNEETEIALKAFLDRYRDGTAEYTVVAQLLGSIHYSRFLSAATPLPQEPRCPKCGSKEIDITGGLSKNGEYSREIGCAGCGGTFTYGILRDLAKFFSPAQNSEHVHLAGCPNTGKIYASDCNYCYRKILEGITNTDPRKQVEDWFGLPYHDLGFKHEGVCAEPGSTVINVQCVYCRVITAMAAYKMNGVTESVTEFWRNNCQIIRNVESLPGYEVIAETKTERGADGVVILLNNRPQPPTPVEPLKIKEWAFDRYRNGQRMAQGITVRAGTEEEAVEKAHAAFDNESNTAFVLRVKDSAE